MGEGVGSPGHDDGGHVGLHAVGCLAAAGAGREVRAQVLPLAGHGQAQGATQANGRRGQVQDVRHQLQPAVGVQQLVDGVADVGAVGLANERQAVGVLESL